MDKIISQNTGVSIGVLIVIVGSILWLANVQANASAAKEGVAEIKLDQKNFGEKLSTLSEAVIRIEENQKLILKELK